MLIFGQVPTATMFERSGHERGLITNYPGFVLLCFCAFLRDLAIYNNESQHVRSVMARCNLNIVEVNDCKQTGQNRFGLSNIRHEAPGGGVFAAAC